MKHVGSFITVADLRWKLATGYQLTNKEIAWRRLNGNAPLSLAIGSRFSLRCLPIHQWLCFTWKLANPRVHPKERSESAEVVGAGDRREYTHDVLFINMGVATTDPKTQEDTMSAPRTQTKTTQRYKKSDKSIHIVSQTHRSCSMHNVLQRQRHGTSKIYLMGINVNPIMPLPWSSLTFVWERWKWSEN